MRWLDSDLEPEYAAKMHEVLDNSITDQKDWCYLFTNWEYMTLKESIVQGQDYYIIS